MNPTLENKLIIEAKKFGFRPYQPGPDGKFIKTRDQYRGWHILHTRKHWIHLCDRFLKKKEGKICVSVLKKDGTLEKLYNGKIVSIKFFKELLINVGCSLK